MRIGFLFNHDQIHQVAHSLPTAIALARAGGHEIRVAVTNDALAAEVERLGGDGLRRHGVAVEHLRLRSRWRRTLATAASSVVPAEKLLVYGDNLDFFRTLDMLVVAEKTSLAVRRFAGLERLPIVHTRHGAGDRAIGFDPASAGFDLVLVPGKKVRRRLIDVAGVAPERIRIVGYPKFDLEPRSPAPFPEEGPPVVLYNPHVSPHLSSWYAMGPAVLDWFVRNPRYRLVFAPHVMLFHRRTVLTIDRLRVDRPGVVDRSVLDAANVHVDLGSPAATDMTYTRRADVYLGDVSSQVYEFLREPKPCVFLDAHGPDWRGDPNYAHWTAGRVVSDVERLGEALDAALDEHRTHYRAVQRQLLERTFDLTEEPSADRAARAIADFAASRRGAVARDVRRKSFRRRGAAERSPSASAI
jgi:hypothetical protein